MNAMDLPEIDLGRDALRAVLDCLPDPALLMTPNHRILSVNRAYTRTFGNGRAVLGRPCYEVLHHRRRPCAQDGEECPVTDTAATGQPSCAVHVHHGAAGEEHHHVRVLPIGGEHGDPTGYLELVQRCEGASVSPRSDRLIGRSPAFNRMLGLLYRVAASRLPILLCGEPGTEKERVARVLHGIDGHRRGSFVAVHCSGLDEARFEHELFGAGGDGGAVGAAQGGTLFLGEVGDLPAQAQLQLVRLLRRFDDPEPRDGATEPFQLVCSSHRDLAHQVEEGSFRADLHHRIGSFPVRVPPLRERREDLPLLIGSLLQAIRGERALTLHPDTRALLDAYPFPGNLHELRHLLERACLMADGDTLLPRHLPEECRLHAPQPATLVPRGEIVPLEEMETRYLSWAAASFDGDNASLARKLGIAERTLYRKLRRLRTPSDPVD
jgi:DNA-binding NtrC family response regulator